jgi:hypothetical protein
MRGWIGTLLMCGGALVVVATACSRSATQNNFLGKACTTDADCLDLVCFQGTCHNHCNVDTDCQAGETCQNHACAGGSKGIDMGTNSGGPGATFGQVLANNLPAMGGMGTLSVDSVTGRATYTSSGTDQFGQSTTQLAFVKSGETGGTIMSFPGGAGSAGSAMGLYAFNGWVYYLSMGAGTMQLNRVAEAVGASPSLVKGLSGGVTSTGLIGGSTSLYFFHGTLEVADTSQSTLTFATVSGGSFLSPPTIQSQTGGAIAAAVNGTTFYIVGDGGKIYTSNVGATALTDTGATLPSAVTNVGWFAVSGTPATAYFQIPMNGNVFALPVTSGSSAMLVGNITGTTAVSGDTGVGTVNGMALVKFPLANPAAQTTLASSAPNIRALGLTSDHVIAYVMGSTGYITQVPR